jgi:Tfp pilus assembly protein PilN
MIRNLKLIDAVITLRDIAKLVERETSADVLSSDIKRCADRLHEVSLVENQTIDIINKAKE